jgi:hypothetical protein
MGRPVVVKETIKNTKPTAREIRAQMRQATIEELIENAKGFVICFLVGPMNRIEQIATTYKTAAEMARDLNREYGQFGRRACLYALDSKGRREVVTYGF